MCVYIHEKSTPKLEAIQNDCSETLFLRNYIAGGKKKKKVKYIKSVYLDWYLWKTDLLFHFVFLCELSLVFLSKHKKPFSLLPLFEFKGKSDGMKTFFQLKCRDSNEIKYSMHS